MSNHRDQEDLEEDLTEEEHDAWVAVNELAKKEREARRNNPSTQEVINFIGSRELKKLPRKVVQVTININSRPLRSFSQPTCTVWGTTCYFPTWVRQSQVTQSYTWSNTNLETLKKRVLEFFSPHEIEVTFVIDEQLRSNETVLVPHQPVHTDEMGEAVFGISGD